MPTKALVPRLGRGNQLNRLKEMRSNVYKFGSGWQPKVTGAGPGYWDSDYSFHPIRKFPIFIQMQKGNTNPIPFARVSALALTLRRMQDGRQVDVLDHIYWGDRNASAPNDWCDADCQADPNRAAMLSLQLQDLAPNDARALHDPADWAAGEATAKGKGGGVEYVDGASATRLLGKKEYEQARNTQLAIGPLKILGNIRVVVTDRKMSDIVAALPVDFEAEVVVMRDYYPFGMEQPGQQYVASEYRYGFQGHGAG